MNRILAEYVWDKVPMELLELEYADYLLRLYTAVEEGDPEGGAEVPDTESGVPFCGCETCLQRETFAFLMPRFINLYEDGHIRRHTPQQEEQ